MESCDIFKFDLFPHKYKGEHQFRTYLGGICGVTFIVTFITFFFISMFAPDVPENYQYIKDGKHPKRDKNPNNFQDINLNWDGNDVQLYIGFDAILEYPTIDDNFSTLNALTGCVSQTVFCDQYQYLKHSLTHEEMQKKEYEIYTDVKVAKWGGNSTSGYGDLYKNLRENLYNINDAVETVDTDGETKYYTSTKENYKFVQDKKTQIFPFKHKEFENGEQEDAAVYPIFSEKFAANTNKQPNEDIIPGQDEILIISLQAEKSWLSQQSFGLGFILNLKYSVKQLDRLSGKNMDRDNFQTIMKEVEGDEQIWVKLGDFYDVQKVYGTKQAPIKKDYIRLYSYDVESIFLDNAVCDHILCQYGFNTVNEIKQISNIKPLSKEYIGIHEEDGQESLWSKTAQQQFDWKEEASEIKEKVTFAQFWLVPSIESKQKKQNTFIIREKWENNFTISFLYMAFIYFVQSLIVKFHNKAQLSKELESIEAIPKDYTKKYEKQNLAKLAAVTLVAEASKGISDKQNQSQQKDSQMQGPGSERHSLIKQKPDNLQQNTNQSQISALHATNESQVVPQISVNKVEDIENDSEKQSPIVSPMKSKKSLRSKGRSRGSNITLTDSEDLMSEGQDNQLQQSLQKQTVPLKGEDTLKPNNFSLDNSIKKRARSSVAIKQVNPNRRSLNWQPKQLQASDGQTYSLMMPGFQNSK